MVPSSTPMKAQSFTAALGPYMWKTNNNQEAVLVRNPEYKDGSFDPALFPAANPDEIVEKFGIAPQQEATAVINGQADYMWDEVPGDQLNELAEKSPEQVKVNPSPFVDYAFLNTRVAPFNNKKAREAANYAANRAAYVNAAGGSRISSVSCQIIPAASKGYEPFCPWTANPAPNGEGEWSAPDLAKAKQLVKESGTEGESVQVSVQNSEKQLGEQFVDDLNSIGYKAEMKLLTPTAVYAYQQDSANEPQAGISYWQEVIGGGLSFINLLSCGSFHPNSDASSNLAEYCNKKIDAEIASIEELAVTDIKGAYAKMAKIDQELTLEAPWVTLFNHQDVDIVSSRLKNYVYNPLTQFLPDVASVE
ncbi:MAG TPA: ABC transporter substrate-binding protein, partial [Propionibacteriaceae bacterium]|nr:ABC transporter substrate-binding protein [Propionibacteriaceae bacterium]